MRLLVVTEDQVLYVYNIDSNEGGDLVLLKQHRLDGKDDGVKSSSKDVLDGAAANSETGNYGIYILHCVWSVVREIMLCPRDFLVVQNNHKKSHLVQPCLFVFLCLRRFA